jgi:hypothetical protein
MDAVLKWIFLMNKYVSGVVPLLCCTLFAGWANAADLVTHKVTVVNESRENLWLTHASWPLGEYDLNDYVIPMHHTGEFEVDVADTKKGRVDFSYTAGEKKCRFRGGLAQSKYNGWILPDYRTIGWSKAKSTGSVHADCKASFEKSTEGDGYHLQFIIK